MPICRWVTSECHKSALLSALTVNQDRSLAGSADIATAGWENVTGSWASNLSQMRVSGSLLLQKTSETPRVGYDLCWGYYPGTGEYCLPTCQNEGPHPGWLSMQSPWSSKRPICVQPLAGWWMISQRRQPAWRSTRCFPGLRIHPRTGQCQHGYRPDASSIRQKLLILILCEFFVQTFHFRHTQNVIIHTILFIPLNLVSPSNLTSFHP